MKAKQSSKQKPKASSTPVHPQHEDVWSRAQTINGYAADEIRSVLQKSIRRGLLEEALLAAYEYYCTGPEMEELLWRRLEIIATEDVGYGLINAPVILEALNAQRHRIPPGPDRWIYSAHAVRLLATAKKDRTSMELASWAEAVTSRGERKVIVHDYQVDFHTRRGTLMGRGRDHWWNSGGSVLLDQIEGLDGRWGAYLRTLNPPPAKAPLPKKPKKKT
jgi:replication-associated recombination protein RarA